MIINFKNKGTEDIFNGDNTKKAGKICPHYLHEIACRKLDILNVATTLEDLRSPPSNKLEHLEKDRVGQHSIRINNQYRICFIWTIAGSKDIEIVDYH